MKSDYAWLALGSVLMIGASSKLLGSRGMDSLSPEEITILRQHFAVPADKKIPPSYIKNELARFTVLPEDLRTPEQQKIVQILEKYVT